MAKALFLYLVPFLQNVQWKISFHVKTLRGPLCAYQNYNFVMAHLIVEMALMNLVTASVVQHIIYFVSSF